MTSKIIRAIEELSINAWPALHTILYDGWVLRFAGGYTKRANSINPLYPSQLDIDEKIRACEKVYQSQDLKVIYKLTPASHPADLDQTLATQGYKFDSYTSVQTLVLDTMGESRLKMVSGAEKVVHERLDEGWLSDFCRINEMGDQQRDYLRLILANLMPRSCFISLHSQGKGIACGLGVLQNGSLGLFDIATDARHRNQGYGSQVIRTLLNWGKQNGAHQAYLQVLCDNDPALHLYEKIGFAEIYRYWYRVKPGEAA